QYITYGFEFSKSEPHQEKTITLHDPVILNDEDALFEAIITRLIKAKRNPPAPPDLVFCKDINTAKRFYKKLQERMGTLSIPSQLYTGMEKEEAEVIQKGAESGMITVATSALGRNTDLPYDKKVGLNVWHTFVDATRLTGQKSGRTGRQGSKGDVHFYFTKQELQGKEAEALGQAIDEQAAAERKNNEDLFDVLGYLFRRVDTIPSDHFKPSVSTFIKEQWSDFSKKTEQRYKNAKSTGGYDRTLFITETVTAFNVMVATSVDPIPKLLTEDEITASLDHKFVQRPKYEVAHQEVRLKECTPAFEIAYHLLNLEPSNANALTKEAIITKLKDQFEDLGRGLDYSALNAQYLNYLYLNPVAQETVVAAHKEFLEHYLKTHSAKNNFFNRMLGFNPRLSTLVNNTNYLAMFHCLASVPEVKVSLD
ncbi:MAG: hypothetical protein ACHP6H_06940, partial [Legionellales bacterium]